MSCNSKALLGKYILIPHFYCQVVPGNNAIATLAVFIAKDNLDELL
jgi:hypothetical protein